MTQVNPERKFADGESVMVIQQRGKVELQMIVVGATLCLKGWKYKLAFTKKDGTQHRHKQGRHFFEDKIEPLKTPSV